MRLLGIMIIAYWLVPKVIRRKVNITPQGLNDAHMTSCLIWQHTELWSYNLTAVSGGYFPIGLLGKDNHCNLLQILHSTAPLCKREQKKKSHRQYSPIWIQLPLRKFPSLDYSVLQINIFFTLKPVVNEFLSCVTWGVLREYSMNNMVKSELLVSKLTFKVQILYNYLD